MGMVKSLRGYTGRTGPKFVSAPLLEGGLRWGSYTDKRVLEGGLKGGLRRGSY